MESPERENHDFSVPSVAKFNMKGTLAMSQVCIKWIEGRQFVGIDSTRHSVVMSTIGPDGGIGMKPSELLLVALGGCTAVDVIGILEKKQQKVTGLDIYVQGEQDADPPWTFRKIHVEYVVRGRGMSEKAVTQAIELSEGKYCSVSATVAGTAEITSSFRIVEEED
jgi:putative redox protein